MLVVPQWLVDILAPALSADRNQGAVMAEQAARDPKTSALLETILAQEVGTKVPLAQLVQLPVLTNNRRWLEVADQLRTAAQAAHGG